MKYMFFAEGFEEVEALAVIDLMRRAKIDVKMVSITGDKVVTGARNIKVICDELLEDVDISKAEALILPGGNPGFINLEKCMTLKDAVISMVANKDVLIAAICGAPSVLGHWGVLNGRKATVYPGMDDELVGAQVSHENVVIDGNLITSRGMGTAVEFGLAIVEYYTDSKVAADLAKAVVFKNV